MKPQELSSEKLAVNEITYMFSRLRDKHDWNKGEIFRQYYENDKGKKSYFPINYFSSPKKGNAIYLLSGVHGEEPAGPNALVRNLELIRSLSKETPLVVLPLLNPLGYSKNSRYPRSELNSEEDVQNADPFIQDKFTGNFSPYKIGKEAKAISKKVLELSKSYPPLIVLDFHEDNEVDKGYFYYWGKDHSLKKDLASIFLESMQKHVPTHGKERFETRFGEEIIKGVIKDAHDGSLDELFSCDLAYDLSGDKVKGPGARAVFVIETPSKYLPLEQRIRAHSEVIRSLEDFSRIASLFSLAN